MGIKQALKSSIMKIGYQKKTPSENILGKQEAKGQGCVYIQDWIYIFLRTITNELEKGGQ